MGNVIAWIAPQSRFSQQFPPASTFDPERDIPDLTGKVALVTGGNAGIGYHTVKHLLLKNATVYLASRSPARCAEAVTRLRQETGRVPLPLPLDLADLNSVRAAAAAFLQKEDRLDVLFNNAGVMATPTHRLTDQGYDLQFGTNVLGHYFFTTLLIPALARSTAYHKTKARIIHTSSSAHKMAPEPTGLDWSTVKGGSERDAAVKRYGIMAEWRLYGQSKIGNILLSHIFRRYHGDVVVSCAVHPGGIMTDLYQHMPVWQRSIIRWVLHPPSFGALGLLWAGTTPEAEGVSGKYIIPWTRIGKATAPSDDEETQDRLKAWMEEQVKAY